MRRYVVVVVVVATSFKTFSKYQSSLFCMTRAAEGRYWMFKVVITLHDTVDCYDCDLSRFERALNASAMESASIIHAFAGRESCVPDCVRNLHFRQGYIAFCMFAVLNASWQHPFVLAKDATACELTTFLCWWNQGLLGCMTWRAHVPIQKILRQLRPSNVYLFSASSPS